MKGRSSVAPDSVWRRKAGAPAAYKLTDSGAVMVGGPDAEVSSSAEDGNIIKGPLSIIASPGEIRIAGVFVMNDLLMSMIPSTIVSPIPTLIFSPPLQGAKQLRDALAILSAFI